MRVALCNEVIAPMPFPKQCQYAAKLGYDGLEIAPYTMSEEPHRMGAAQIAAARAAAEDAGIAVTGLHWLLLKPQGLSISTRDDRTRQRTVDVMLALIDQCAELGGRYLVHGSPHQRRMDSGDTRQAATARARDCFAAVAERAEKAGVLYCIEPLSSDQTPLINTLEEAAALVGAIGSRAVSSMLDCSAAGRMETAPLPALVDRWMPKGMIAHVQVNDRNRRGPGQGEQRFAPLLAALVRHGYAGDIAVEPFDYVPDGPGAAARAIGYIKGILEALQERYVVTLQPELRLRDALPADADFVYQVVEATMRGYVEKTWGSFNKEGNRKDIADRIAARTYQLIECGGEDVGAMCVERHATHIQLEQLFILPEHQNRGIGSSLVRTLATEAKQAGKPLRLRVLAVNPARRLYEREGFRVTSTTPERIYMELHA